jgi:chorismate mutase/prephenate dehydratase
MADDAPQDGNDDKKDEHLRDLRAQIDEIDRRLVEILNERARVVVEVGKRKRDASAPIYAPHREAEVLERAMKANAGPLPDRTIEGVYRELMSGSFALEQPLRIGFLGPPGSFSHQAAVAHFGSSVSFEDLHDILGVFTEVRRGHVDYGLVPIENSTGGAVTEALDAFRDARGEVSIYAEVAATIRHSLLSNHEPRDVKKIHSKPEVFAQCRRWIATQYPQSELIPAASSSHAVRAVAQAYIDDPSQGAAAIGSALAGQLYGVKVLFSDIEDNPNNITRFFVIARQRAERSGDDKTTVMFSTENAPGALAQVLKTFADAGINLSHIDKRPSGRENWNYTFFVDAHGHRDEPIIAQTLRLLEHRCQELHVLGSYPRARRIL